MREIRGLQSIIKMRAKPTGDVEMSLRRMVLTILDLENACISRRQEMHINVDSILTTQIVP